MLGHQAHNTIIEINCHKKLIMKLAKMVCLTTLDI